MEDRLVVGTLEGHCSGAIRGAEQADEITAADHGVEGSTEVRQQPGGSITLHAYRHGPEGRVVCSRERCERAGRSVAAGPETSHDFTHALHMNGDR